MKIRAINRIPTRNVHFSKNIANGPIFCVPEPIWFESILTNNKQDKIVIDKDKWCYVYYSGVFPWQKWSSFLNLSVS